MESGTATQCKWLIGRPFQAILQSAIDLHDSTVNGYKEAHHVRIGEAFAMKGVATAWFLHYAEMFGGIVLAFDQLEGGKRQWNSFIYRDS